MLHSKEEQVSQLIHVCLSVLPLAIVAEKWLRSCGSGKEVIESSCEHTCSTEEMKLFKVLSDS
jgi:hypothetical protein